METKKNVLGDEYILIGGWLRVSVNWKMISKDVHEHGYIVTIGDRTFTKLFQDYQSATSWGINKSRELCQNVLNDVDRCKNNLR